MTLPIGCCSALRQAAATSKKVLESLLSNQDAKVNGFAEDEWHVSISPLLMLRKPQIDEFLAATSDAVDHWRQGGHRSIRSIDRPTDRIDQFDNFLFVRKFLKR